MKRARALFRCAPSTLGRLTVLGPSRLFARPRRCRLIIYNAAHNSQDCIFLLGRQSAEQKKNCPTYEPEVGAKWIEKDSMR
jgi:hypothetical protein